MFWDLVHSTAVNDVRTHAEVVSSGNFGGKDLLSWIVPLEELEDTG
jgi:hypothetical protein